MTYHAAPCDVVEPFNKLDSGGFAATTGTDQSQRLSRFHLDIQALENLDVWSSCVVKPNLVESYPAFTVTLKAESPH